MLKKNKIIYLINILLVINMNIFSKKRNFLVYTDQQKKYINKYIDNPYIKDKVFREYDIRGKINSEICIDKTYDLGRAIAYYFKQQNPNIKKITIGMDGRIHSLSIKKQLCKAMIDSGLDVIFIGVCTSPILYFTLCTQKVDAGLMITASHNPKEYNGIKIRLGKKSIWGQEIQIIKKMFHENKKTFSITPGTYTEKNMINLYANWIKDHFPNLVGMDLSAIIDCGNGSTGTVMPHLIKKMEWKQVKLLFKEVDGNYPNHEANPVVEKNMRHIKDFILHENKKNNINIKIGIGFDGDGDRMAPITENGKLVSADVLLGVYAKSILEKTPGASIVCDINTSNGLLELIEQYGGKPIMSPAGHSIIKEIMDKNNALLGGEISCHLFFADKFFGYDDGIYAMMRLFEIMIKTQKNLSELISVFPKKINSRQMRIKCPDDKKKEIVSKVKSLFDKRSDVTIITIDGIRAIMDYGWGILRASNTQPAVTLRIESDTQNGLKKVKEDFYNAMKPYFEKNVLKKHIFS